MENHLAAVDRQLALQDGGKFIFDASLEHFAAGGDDAHLLGLHGQHVQDRLCPGGSLHGVHLLLLDDQRDDAGTGQLLALFHRQVAVDGGDHHLRGAVYSHQRLAVDLQQAVAVRDQLDLPLFRRSAVDIFACSGLVQQGSCLVLVEDAGVLFPDVEVLLADGKQHRDILGLDDVPLAETGILVLARDDLGDIMAEHLPCGVNSTDQFHDGILLTARASGLRSSLPVPAYRSGQNLRRGYPPPPPAAGRKRAHPKWRCAPPRSSASRWI